MDPIFWYAVAVAVVIVCVFAWIVYAKGRLLPGAHVFRASRFSRGNHLLPTQVAVTDTSVLHYQPQWVGKLEHSIHIAHVASVRIDTFLLFSDVYIETTGGASPIHCRGHRKHDAVEIKRLIDDFQTSYYRGQPPARGASV
jgi:hypothetical protein